MSFNREKFAAMVHYACWKAGDPSKLGSTKLNKVCWLADFLTYYESGNAITNATYVKRPFGPVPRAMVPTLDSLRSRGAIEIEKKQFHQFIQTQYIAQFEPDMERFTASEMETLNFAINYVTEQHTATSISNFSHDHIWQAASDGEELPYYTIFATPAPLLDSDREWARQELELI